MQAARQGHGSAAPRAAVERPWVEKYRPRTMDEVAFQFEVVEVLRKCIQGSDMPHLLFYGPPGTGKTSTILALSRELFGPELMRERVLELNASDERGIDVVREKVKSFAQTTVSAQPVKGFPCPPYKIIILDEADAMTKDAQTALRRTIEQYSKVTRFCLICNYISRIIEPLASRCAKFRFKPLSPPTLLQRLEHVVVQEGVSCSPEILEQLVPLCNGDLRSAITCLQSAHRLHPSGVRLSDVQDILGLIPPPVVAHLMECCLSNSYEKLESAVTNLIADGFAVSQLCVELHDAIMGQESVSDEKKAKIAEKIAKVDCRLVEGGDEFLQAMDLCGTVMSILCGR